MCSPKTTDVLVEAVAFLQGLGDTVDAARGAAMFADMLARRGYSVQLTAGPVLHDLTPKTLRRARSELRLTLNQVAIEAGIAVGTIAGAERDGSRSRQATLEAIAAALVRFGARRPA